MKKEDIMVKDLYYLLGCCIEDSKSEIRRAFRKKSLECHPDKNPNNPEAAKLFTLLNNAVEILTDDVLRPQYDSMWKARPMSERYAGINVSKDAAWRRSRAQAKTSAQASGSTPQPESREGAQPSGFNVSQDAARRRAQAQSRPSTETPNMNNCCGCGARQTFQSSGSNVSQDAARRRAQAQSRASGETPRSTPQDSHQYYYGVSDDLFDIINKLSGNFFRNYPEENQYRQQPNYQSNFHCNSRVPSEESSRGHHNYNDHFQTHQQQSQSHRTASDFNSNSERPQQSSSSSFTDNTWSNENNRGPNRRVPKRAVPIIDPRTGRSIFE